MFVKLFLEQVDLFGKHDDVRLFVRIVQRLDPLDIVPAFANLRHGLLLGFDFRQAGIFDLQVPHFRQRNLQPVEHPVKPRQVVMHDRDILLQRRQVKGAADNSRDTQHVQRRDDDELGTQTVGKERHEGLQRGKPLNGNEHVGTAGFPPAAHALKHSKTARKRNGSFSRDVG